MNDISEVLSSALDLDPDCDCSELADALCRDISRFLLSKRDAQGRERIAPRAVDDTVLFHAACSSLEIICDQVRVGDTRGLLALADMRSRITIGSLDSLIARFPEEHQYYDLRQEEVEDHRTLMRFVLQIVSEPS